VDDGLDAGLITLDQLEKLAFWKLAAARTREQYAALDDGHFLRITIRNLLDLQAQDILREGHLRLEKYKPRTIADVMNASERLIIFGDEMAEMLEEFSSFLYRQLYEHPDVLDANDEAVELMRGLFHHYVRYPEAMGKKAQARIAEEGLMRTVCDYVAGCTDRYALEECKKYGIA
jgi:dGTPase